ncbi:hypothetical protein NM208_g14473 [Fusarium decemcellulare]|uniref:Uncharacterized protein n=1 Tax=Fusarium decemcellulare TaxID=57161 RepID=A0ACC1RHQ7_9HYPO|nr:hypothetical protein NM208_g14473 [Fusarium decemcellulare]
MPSSVVGQALLEGDGCVCMAPTGNGDKPHDVRTERCCGRKGGIMQNTVNFWDRGNFYCYFQAGIDASNWDQDCCRKWYGDGTYGYCNRAT